MPNNLDIDYLAGYFAQLLTLFEGSVLTWHHKGTGDVMRHACLMGQSPRQVGSHITSGCWVCAVVICGHVFAKTDRYTCIKV